MSGQGTSSRRRDGQPETQRNARFVDLRESGGRSEAPDGALDEVSRTLFGPVPAAGERHGQLIELAHRGAEAGQTNDWILRTLDVACDLWGKYPNVFDRWTRLLKIVALARSTYPNGPQGQGWRP